MAINPASLLPGAGPLVPGAVSITPDLAHSSSPRPAGVLQASASTTGLQVAAEGGINLDMPAQVTTLQNANKVGRIFELVLALRLHCFPLVLKSSCSCTVHVFTLTLHGLAFVNVIFNPKPVCAGPC